MNATSYKIHRNPIAKRQTQAKSGYKSGREQENYSPAPSNPSRKVIIIMRLTLKALRWPHVPTNKSQGMSDKQTGEKKKASNVLVSFGVGMHVTHSD